MVDQEAVHAPSEASDGCTGGSVGVSGGEEGCSWLDPWRMNIPTFKCFQASQVFKYSQHMRKSLEEGDFYLFSFSLLGWTIGTALGYRKKLER
jgi:hypothetical protein